MTRHSSTLTERTTGEEYARYSEDVSTYFRDE